MNILISVCATAGHHNGFCSLKNRVWRTPAFKRAHGSLICVCFYIEKPLSKTKGSILCVFYDSFCTLAAMMQCYRIKHQFHASETVTNPAAKNGWHILLAHNKHFNIGLRDGRCRQNGFSDLVLAKRSKIPWLKYCIGISTKWAWRKTVCGQVFWAIRD